MNATATSAPERILFVSYWTAGEPLIASMVLPYLRLLAARADVAHITLVTLASDPRQPNDGVLPPLPKVTHRPIPARRGLPHVLAKAELTLRTARTLARIARDEGSGLIIAASTMAGAPAMMAARRADIPFAVYCVEPHADYMVECGAWTPGGSKHRFAKWMEQRQLREAFRVMTVTELYRQDLLRTGLDPARSRTMPCVIDTEAFRFSPEAREHVRRELGVPPDALLGVYAGKFGGLYYDEEAFTVFRALLDRRPDAQVVVLTTMDNETIRAKAGAAGITPQRFHVRAVPHAHMPAHLSAADLAFSTIRPAPSKRAQCPVKNGEYWAAGLPILMSDGVGDDHLLMRQGIGGAVFSADLHDLDQALDRVLAMVLRPGIRDELHELAVRTRSLSIAERLLNELLDDLARGGR
jgi:glycosyltransferase involved in cell wall biosynthesis